MLFAGLSLSMGPRRNLTTSPHRHIATSHLSRDASMQSLNQSSVLRQPIYVRDGTVSIFKCGAQSYSFLSTCWRQLASPSQGTASSYRKVGTGNLLILLIVGNEWCAAATGVYDVQYREQLGMLLGWRLRRHILGCVR
jgi:hypothetical protein